ncbi:hypothetical protein DL763_003427 [Monosporascus cannonballus]|nr:hypothetical protein DL763_003427 [Monosporascus cannonballus]
MPVTVQPTFSSPSFILAASFSLFFAPDGDVLVWGRSGLPPNARDVLGKWAREYGELFRLRIGWYDWVVVNSPEAFKEIFDKQSISTSSKIPAPIGHDVVTGGLRMFTMSYGPHWRAHRTVMHRLLAPKPTLQFVPSQEFEVKQFLYQLAFDNEDQGAFFGHVRRMSFSIVTTSTYGRRIESNDHPDLSNAGEASALLGRITRPGVFIEDDIPLLAMLPKFLQPSRRQAKKYADIILRGKMRSWNQLKTEIDAGIAAPSFGRDLAESDYKSQGLTDEDAAWITGGLVEAGAEITAVVIQNLILYLAATPDAQKKAHAELDRVVGKSRAPNFADLQSLPYVRACVKEILRLCPVPTWAVKHFSDAEVTYKHHRIPKGTVLLANTTAMHWDPERYPEPHVFRPERYLGHTKYSAEYATMSDPLKRDHFTFGGGRRLCPASTLAENTLDITVANMLWAFELLPPTTRGADGKEVEGSIDTSDNAFQASAFRGPKPFRTRFVLRSQEQGEIVRTQWETARATGYKLRGQTVNAQGVEKHFRCNWRKSLEGYRDRCPLRICTTPEPTWNHLSRHAFKTTTQSRSSHPPSPKAPLSRTHSRLTSSGATNEETLHTPLQALAARITTHADALAAAAAELSHPPRLLSPSPANPSRLLPANAPASARAEQVALRDALAEASILAMDATEFVPDLAVRNNQFASVRWLCHFDIPKFLPLEAEDKNGARDGAANGSSAFPALPYSVVAEAAGVPEHQLRSIARMAMLVGFLSEPAADRLAHSPLSAAMVKQPGLLEWARFVTSTSAKMVPAMVEATERWGGDRSISKTAYAVAWQTDLPLFEHVAADPDLQARYAAYMRVMTQSEGMALGHLLEGWKAGWAALERRGAVLVDVGGSAGHASVTLARAYPGIKAVVQDRPEVVERAQNESASRLKNHGIKLAFQAHDFFKPQPARPRGFEDEGRGDVYLLRQILHDWGDEQSITILRHMAAALEGAGRDARLVVMDTVLPSPGEGSRTEEAMLRVRDLTMQQAHNAHERSEVEWKELLRRASPALKIKRVVQPFKSVMAVIEIAFE